MTKAQELAQQMIAKLRVGMTLGTSRSINLRSMLPEGKMIPEGTYDQVTLGEKRFQLTVFEDSTARIVRLR